MNQGGENGRGLRILLATDAWRPQVNGVVRTWETTIAQLQRRGHTVEVIEPQQFAGFPCPFYPEIRLCRPGRAAITRQIRAFQPDSIHIATEGPIGLAVRGFCGRHRLFFTTSYHTQFPEYLRELCRAPVSLSYAYMRWFHQASSAILVATPSLEAQLRQRGFSAPIRRWSRGVDLSLFHPRPREQSHLPRPIMLYVGRVSKEKNIEAFLSLVTPGTKVICGDGPHRARLEGEFPTAVFLGYRKGEALAQCYANADLFVFPSKTDTFGLVMIEALACGIPVAAYPVIGPMDIVTDSKVGALNTDLEVAVRQALAQAEPEACTDLARQYTWEHCTAQMLESLIDCRTGAGLLR